MQHIISPSITDDLTFRWNRLRHLMRQNNIEACLLMGNENLFYASGRVFNGYFYLPVEGAPFFFVKRPVGLEGENVVYIRKPEDIPSLLKENGLPLAQTIMLEGEEIGHSEWLRLENAIKPSLAINGTPLIRKARSVKSPFELDQLRLSGKKQSEVYERIPQLYSSGMTDLQLSIEIERAMRIKGSLGVFRVFGLSMEIFMGSILAGDNASVPSPYDFSLGGQGQHPSIPVGENDTLLQKGKTVMVDMGGNFTGYTTDMTRIFAIGEIPQEAYRVHQVALDIQDFIIKKAKPGIRAEELYIDALQIVEQHKLSHCFMGTLQQAKFVGHGIGIEINELPVLCNRSTDVLEEGQVIAIEPKFIVEGVGGVGIENSFIVRSWGLEQITFGSDEIICLPA